MTNVTALTKELVEQFEFAVGRRVTAAEYMDLRKQAIFELGSGYSIPSSQPDITCPFVQESPISYPMTNNPYNYSQNVGCMNTPNPIFNNPNTMQAVPKPAVPQNEPSVQLTQQPVSAEPVREPQTNVVEHPVAHVETKQSDPVPVQTPVSNTATNQTATIKPVVAQITKENDNSNDFFKLVGKFMQ